VASVKKDSVSHASEFFERINKLTDNRNLIYIVCQDLQNTLMKSFSEVKKIKQP